MSELTAEENQAIDKKIMDEKRLDRPPFLRDIKRNVKDEKKRLANLPKTEKELDIPASKRNKSDVWEEIHGKSIPNPGVYYREESDDKTPALERNKPEKWKEITDK